MTSSPIPPSEPRAILAGHGTFADGLIAAVAEITGRGDVFLPLSNAGHGTLELERIIRELVDERGIEIIFTDLPAGSCTIAARRVLRERPSVTLVTGANLAALLDFALHAGRSPGDAARHAVDRAREAIVVLGGGSAPPAGPGGAGGAGGAGGTGGTGGTGGAGGGR